MSGTVTPPPGFTLVAPSQSDSGNDLKPNPGAYQAVQESSGLSRPASPPPGFKSVQPSHLQGDAATEQLYQDLTPQPRTSRTTGEDVQQGIAHGLVSGSTSVLGLPADIWHMLKSENKAALTYGAQAVGLMTPEEGAKWRAEPPDEQHPMTSAWITKHVKDLAQSAGRDVSPAQTVPGQYAETAASFIPMAAATPFMAEGTAAKALAKVPVAVARYGVLPAVTSETAGQATKGTAAESYARVAAAIGPEAAIQSMGAARRALSPVKGMMDGVTDTQRSEAQRLLDESRTAGTPLTVPEAVQQATGNGTRLGDIQRVVEQSPKGAGVLRPFMAARPGQTETLGRSTFDQLAPAGADPYEIAPKVQAAADQTVSDANTARTQAVDPFYKAAATDRVPLTDMNDFLSRIDGMIASDKTGIMGPELSKLRASLIETPGKPGTPAQRIPTTTPTGATIYRNVPAVPPTPAVPITDIENLDRVRKYFRDRMDLPQWSQDATSKEEIGKVGSLLGDLRQKMISASPDFTAGKSLYQGITENIFNPLTRSPTGQLAVAETYPKQAQILFNPNPLPGSERAIGKAVRDVAKTDPDAAAQLVRAHLEKTFNEATQNNLPGANQFGGPKFAAVVSGNTQQAKNLEAAVRALPNGGVRWNALRKGLDIMEGMGARQPVGSQTAFNAQINKWMEQGHPAGEFLVNAASPGRWPSLVNSVYRHVMFDRNTGELARAFAQGSVADLRDIARSGSRSFQGQAAMIGMLARQGAMEESGANQP